MNFLMTSLTQARGNFTTFFFFIFSLQKIKPLEMLHHSEEFYISNTDEVEKCCKRIREGLNNIEINGQNASDGPFHSVLAEMKQGNIKRLRIKSDRITEEGMKSISNFLSQDGIILEELDLDNNRFGDECCAHLAKGLKKNKTLKKLNL
eukprot:TRINITY_DN2255_c0_g1_i13.p1 TRINITY_DN2255_c0_g1~~TRINITY_DN2255_c0_g1_i13.p1  ORF type:complete len:149 (-),score=43.26 TRINITY_DN2255_c0_g1_i13:151-597(-)